MSFCITSCVDITFLMYYIYMDLLHFQFSSQWIAPSLVTTPAPHPIPHQSLSIYLLRMELSWLLPFNTNVLDKGIPLALTELSSEVSSNDTQVILIKSVHLFSQVVIYQLFVSSCSVGCTSCRLICMCVHCVDALTCAFLPTVSIFMPTVCRCKEWTGFKSDRLLQCLFGCHQQMRNVWLLSNNVFLSSMYVPLICESVRGKLINSVSCTCHHTGVRVCISCHGDVRVLLWLYFRSKST